jgi:hypothetical protein
MKTVARILTAVALVTLSVLAAGGATARQPDDQRGQQALARTLAREHNAYPAALDEPAQAAQRTLARTLGREHHTYPAPDASPQPANPRQAAQRRTLSTLAVLTMTAVLAMTWRRRARSRFREAR